MIWIRFSFFGIIGYVVIYYFLALFMFFRWFEIRRGGVFIIDIGNVVDGGYGY